MVGVGLGDSEVVLVPLLVLLVVLVLVLVLVDVLVLVPLLVLVLDPVLVAEEVLEELEVLDEVLVLLPVLVADDVSELVEVALLVLVEVDDKLLEGVMEGVGLLLGEQLLSCNQEHKHARHSISVFRLAVPVTTTAWPSTSEPETTLVSQSEHHGSGIQRGTQRPSPPLTSRKAQSFPDNTSVEPEQKAMAAQG